jgi:hypothetical protein
MRKCLVACALISTTSWLVACGTDPIESTSHPKDGGAGSSQAGSGGVSGTGGQGGSAVTTGGGGNGGSAVGGSGGTAGNIAGSGGTPVVEAGPPVSLCDGKAKKTLPFTIMSDYRAVTVIGTKSTFSITPSPDCITAYPVPEGGTEAGSTDAASADSTDDTQTLALDEDAGDSATGDATASDAGTSDAKSDAAPVEAGPPPPACYEFRYEPSLCEAAECWAGVIFTPGAALPAQDAAVVTSTGVCIELGATKIEFMARSNRPGARIKFGSIRPGQGTTEFFLTVTTQWALYTIAIPPGDMYNETATPNGGVWNGFSVVVEPGDHTGGTIISVKDVTWKK